LRLLSDDIAIIIYFIALWLILLRVDIVRLSDDKFFIYLSEVASWKKEPPPNCSILSYVVFSTRGYGIQDDWVEGVNLQRGAPMHLM
jgi:hypothetical protein